MAGLNESLSNDRLSGRRSVRKERRRDLIIEKSVCFCECVCVFVVPPLIPFIPSYPTLSTEHSRLSAQYRYQPSSSSTPYPYPRSLSGKVVPATEQE